MFPERKPPQVAEYSIRKTYGRLLDMFEKAFTRTSPLFALPMQWATEGRRPGWRAWLGGSIAVLGAALLKWLSA